MPACVIVDFRVVNPDGLEPCAEKMVRDTIAARRRFEHRRPEGDRTPTRMAILQFGGGAATKGRYDSPEYLAIPPHRLNSTNDRLIIVERL